MDKNKLARFLYWYNHTVCPTIDIEEDITNLCDYMNEFDNIDFDQWLGENDLFEQYIDYIKYI